MIRLQSSAKLKVWTIITHWIILIGFGHGILALGVIDILWFPYFTKPGFTFLPAADIEHKLPMVGLLGILGTIILGYSIKTTNEKRKIISHVAGLALLWLCIFYFVYKLELDSYTHFATLTAFPFLFCTLYAFLGGLIKPKKDAGID